MRQAVTKNKSSTNIFRIISFQSMWRSWQKNWSIYASKPPDPEYGPSQAAAIGSSDGDLDLYS
jgi:hypothetical protein